MTATPDIDDSTAADDALYAELDKHSGNVRKLAFELASQFGETENRSKELNLCIKALSTLSSSDIKNFDDAMTNVKKSIAYLTFQSTGTEMFGPDVAEERIPALAILYGQFIEAVMTLAEKGLEIRESHSQS